MTSDHPWKRHFPPRQITTLLRPYIVDEGTSRVSLRTMINIDQIFDKERRASSVIIYNDAEVEFRPFAFVLNVKGLIGANCIDLAAGYTLRRAVDSEIDYIKDFLKSKFGTEANTAIWENRAVASGKEPKLPKKLWRYFVIEFGNDDPNLDLLEAALAVAPNGLEIGLAKVRIGVKGVVRPACLYRAPSLFQSISALNFASANREKLMQSVGKTDGEQIQDIFVRMARHNNTLLDLSRVVALLMQLKDLPRFSPLQILGYFAVLESILAHQPKAEDRYETITRQITQKLALLNKRWSPMLDYSLFGGADHKKLWKEMYSYRSSIAHGRKPDFNSELQVLKNADAANTLIKDAVGKVVRQAYAEPQLLADLYNV